MQFSMKDSVSNDNLIGHRLRSEMKKQGISSMELAKRADVKTSFLYDVISGKSANPSTVKLARVAECLGISLMYLVDSPGYGQENANPVVPAQTDYVSIARIFVEGKSELVSREEKNEAYSFRKSWIEDRLRVNPADLRLLTMHGDSMEPTLYHNDAILIDITKKTPTPPGLFVLFDGLGLVAKRLEPLRSQSVPSLRIMSDNAHYSAYERPSAEILIVGRVIWFAREM